MAEHLSTPPKYRYGRRDSIDLPPVMSLHESPLLTDKCKCPVCLDVFTDPVTTPCGHNFCKACLNQCWDNSQDYRCPFCKETSSRRPDVKSNTVLREIVQLLKENTKKDLLCTGGPLSEELQCPVCLDVFTDPVTTPCGHNYCKSCLENFWDYSLVCICPYCKESFSKRPDLKCNTALREIVQLFEKNTGYKREMIVAEYSKPLGTRVQEEPLCKPSVITSSCLPTENPVCFICLEPSIDPVMTPCGHSSCKACLKECWEISDDSRCPCCKESFIERVNLFQKLWAQSYQVEPENIAEQNKTKKIQKHDRALKLFGGDDSMSVGRFCVEGDHKTNNTVHAEDESEEKKMKIQHVNTAVIQKRDRALELFSGENTVSEDDESEQKKQMTLDSMKRSDPIKCSKIKMSKVKMYKLVQQMTLDSMKRNDLIKCLKIKMSKVKMYKLVQQMTLDSMKRNDPIKCLKIKMSKVKMYKLVQQMTLDSMKRNDPIKCLKIKMSKKNKAKEEAADTELCTDLNHFIEMSDDTF